MMPTSLKIKPTVKTREDYMITERANRAFLSSPVHKTYQEKCRLNTKIHALQAGMETELSRADYGKVTTVSQGTTERTHTNPMAHAEPDFEAGEADR